MRGHLHADHPASRREPPRALLAIPGPGRAAALARAFLAVKILPSLAFTVGDLYAHLELGTFAVVVPHLQLEPVDPYLFLAGARRRSAAPMLVLGGAPMTVSEVRALGCDRYLRDNLPPSVVADVAAQLGTRSGGPTIAVQAQQWGPLCLDPGRRQARWRDGPLDLTPMQFAILLTLVEAAGTVVTPSELARRLGGSGTGADTERVVAHVRRIRKRMEDDPANPTFLLTVRGVGFRLADSTQTGGWPITELPIR